MTNTGEQKCWTNEAAGWFCVGGFVFGLVFGFVLGIIVRIQ